MEMHQIRYFLAVARTMNFTRAAAECNVAQPSLTRAIKNLEAELGGDLIRRERSHSHLTELGRSILPFLRQSYEGAISAKSQAASLSKGSITPLRISLSNTLNIELFAQMLSQLDQAFAGLKLNCIRTTANEALEQLKAGDTELCLAGPLDSTWERLDCWPLFTESFQLIVHSDHRFARCDAVTPGELSGERLILRPYCEQSAQCESALEAQGIDLSASHEVMNDVDALHLLEANLGVGFFPASIGRREVLRAVPLTEPRLDRTVCLYVVAGRQMSPAAVGLAKLVRAADWSFLTQRNN